MKYGFKIFYIVSGVLAAVICTGMCIILRAGAPISEAYGAYIAFLLTASLLGGGGVAAGAVLLKRESDADALSAKEEIVRLEDALSNLEEDAQLREQFIASFAHELKTPLTAIIGYADMLRSKDMSPKNRFTAAGYIFSEGRRLEALSLKLMDIIVTGKGEIEKKRTEAGYFIREVAAVSAPSTGGDGLSLDIRWEKAEVEIEPDLFKTLLINLVDNARKASRKGQKVELFGKNEDGGYAFYVKDYGRGIDEKELQRISEPFYMVDKSRSRAQNGAGLGLALAKKIAELHDTTLQYDSTLGKGTTVRVFLKGAEK